MIEWTSGRAMLTSGSGHCLFSPHMKCWVQSFLVPHSQVLSNVLEQYEGDLELGVTVTNGELSAVN